MKLRPFIFLALLVIVLLLLGSSALRLLPRLQYNRAVYDLNQERYSLASMRLQRVLQSRPDYMPARIRIAETMLRQGEYAPAYQSLNELPNSDVQRTYWLALAAYLTNNEKQASQLFRSLAQNSESGHLSYTHQQLSMLGAHALQDWQQPDFHAPLATPTAGTALEQMLINSFQGRIAIHSGNWRQASQQLRQALAANDRNSRSRILACAASLLNDDFSSAQMLIDCDSSPSKFLANVRNETLSLLNDQQTSTITAAELGHQSALLRTREHAGIWLHLQAARFGMEATETTGSAELKDDPVELMLIGDELAQAGNYADAYATYKRATRETPNLQLDLRALSLASNDKVVAQRFSEYSRNNDDNQIIAASETSCTGRLSEFGIAVFRDAGKLSADIMTSAPGQYRITLVASADLAQQKGAVIQPLVDTFSPPALYVGREGWDCYSFAAPLSAGDHHVEFTYSSQADEVSAEGENRSLYVLGIVIGRLQADDH